MKKGLMPFRGIVSFCAFALYLSGLATAQESGRTTIKIAGGSDAEPERFPYMVSLRNPRNNRHYCGGVLVLPEFVVTAAHCIDPFYTRGETHPYPKVWIGGVARDGDENTEKRETYRTYMHKKWKGQFGDGFDIAVIQLNKPSTKKPIKIDRIGVYLLDYRSHFIALGYGYNATKGLPPTLQQVEMSYVNSFTCDEVEGYEGKITFDMICAKGMQDVVADVCQADSGGPLILPPRTRFEREDLLVGIVSFGRTCDRLEKDIPSVFTKAEEFRDWILDKGARESRIFENQNVERERPEEADGDAIVSTNPNLEDSK